jgi:predicted Zn-dependent peptidase
MKRFLIIALLISTAVFAQKPDRSGPPPAGPTPVFFMAPVKHFTLANGLPVVLLEKHQVPLVQINLVIFSGAVDDPAEKSGLASMVATMLTDGAGSRDALAFADAVDYLGATLSGAAGLHTSSLSLHTPVSKLDSALALLGDALLHPAFASAELERHRKERLTMLLSWRDEARTQASALFSQKLFGRNHPYGRMSIGDEKAIRSITADDLRQFHTQYFRPNNATLVIVGDVTVTEMRPKLEQLLAVWSRGTVPQATLPAIEPLEKRTVELVDKPGAPQTEIRIGCIGAPRATEDYYALVVMNTILGGSFSSRLNMNLREVHQYTYGAGSSFTFRKFAGPFTAAASVHTAKTDSSLMEFMKELNGILKPVSQQEVDRAKNFVALGFPADFQTVEDLASKIEDMVIYNLPDGYYNSYIRNVLAVTKADVERVAKKYLNPEKMAVILVGDRKAIEAPVRALRLGTMSNLSVDDVLGKAPVMDAQK